MQTQEKPYPITGDEGEPIDLRTATSWTKNYRERYPGETISHFFGYKILQQILRQERCLGIRIYYANSKSLNSWQRFILAISNFLRKTIAGAEGEKHFIIVGADREGEDQLPEGRLTSEPEKEQITASFTAAAAAYTMGEQAYPCPGSPGCPKNVVSGG